MKEEQRLFLVQAKSAYSVYKYLRSEKTLHHCHALHYLQMATELLGKASKWKDGPVEKSHKAFVPFLQSLSSNTKARRQLGFDRQNENWKHTIRKLTSIASDLEIMVPTLAGEGPNAEYPWPSMAPTIAPAEHNFPIWNKLVKEADGRSLISWIDTLFSTAEEYM